MSRAAVLLVICVALTQGSRVGRSAARPLGRLRGGADREQSVEDALRFTRGCLVGVESEKSLATMLLPPFRLLMKFFGARRAQLAPTQLCVAHPLSSCLQTHSFQAQATAGLMSPSPTS